MGFDEVTAAVKNERVDFILTNSSFYVQLERAYQLNRIATLKNRVLNKVYTEFGGVIFCRKDRSDIRQLSDLKEKTLMGTSEKSFGGWLAGWRELKEKGIDPYQDFKKLIFGGTHDAVVYAVLNGTVDAGIIRTDTLERMAGEGKIKLDDFFILHSHPDEGKKLALLHSTRSYPEWPMAKVKHTTDKLADKVAVALIQMPPDSEAANAAECAGWTAPLNYESVAECLKALQVFPYQNEGGFTFADVLKKYLHLIIAFVAAFIILVFVSIFIFRLHHNLKLANKKLEQAIAERILIENELKKSETKYRSLFESTPDAIMITDKNRFIDCNSASLSMFGFFSKEEFINQSPAQLSPLKQPDGKDSQEASLGYLEEALKKGAIFFEWTHRKKDGTTFPAEVMLSRLEVEGKDITQALVRDVTPRKQIETERERLISQLQVALGHVKTLKGMLPICANCKKVRDDKGYWNQIESYVQQHTDASFTHGLCPDCAKQLYPELYAERKREKKKPGNSIDAGAPFFYCRAFYQKTTRTPSPQIRKTS